MPLSTTNSKPAPLVFILLSVTFMLLGSLVTLPSWEALWDIWMEDGSSYSHGPLIILVALWLVFESWQEIQSNQPAPRLQRIMASLAGLGGGCLWALGFIMGIALFQWVSLPVLFGSLYIVASHQRITLKSTAPFIALYFAMPVWELFVPPLQALAVEVVSIGIGYLNIPAYIEGINVNIPGGRFVIEGGCSGVRYLLVTIAVTSLWGYLYIQNKTYSLWLVLIGTAISIVSNWIRIFLIIIIGYETQMKSSIVHDHEFFGWILFAVALIPIMWIAVRFEKKSPLKENQARCKPQWRWLPFALGIAGMGFIPVVSQLYLLKLQPVELPQLQEKIKTDYFLNQQQLDESIVFGGWQPQFSGMDEWKTYRYQPSKLNILIGHIKNQNQDQELFSATNSFAVSDPGQVWNYSVNDDIVSIRNVYSQKWIGKIFYRVGGVFTEAGLKGKIQQLKSIANGRNDAQIIIIGYKCDDNCQDERNKIETLGSIQVSDWLKLPQTPSL